MAPPTRRRRSKMVGLAIVLGIAVAMAPRDWLTVVTDVDWERSIISMTGLAGAGLAAGVPWALSQRGAMARRAYLWVSVFVMSSVVYVFSVAPFYLIAAFCTGFVGMLDIWMARAHIASTSLRARLEEQAR